MDTKIITGHNALTAAHAFYSEAMKDAAQKEEVLLKQVATVSTQLATVSKEAAGYKAMIDELNLVVARAEEKRNEYESQARSRGQEARRLIDRITTTIEANKDKAEDGEEVLMFCRRLAMLHE